MASQAQVTLGVLSTADKKYDEFAYPEAIKLYEYLVKSGDSSANVIRRLADSYRLTNNVEKAEFWYAYIVSKQKCNSNDIYNYVLLLRGNEKYSLADSILSRLEYKFRRDSRIEKYKQLPPSYIDTLKNEEANYTVKLLEINSEFEDFSPTYYKDQLVFVSSRGEKVGVKREYNWTKEAFLDLYSFKIPTSAKEAKNIKVTPFSKELNSALHEGQLTFSGNGKEVYFTSNNIKRGINFKSSSGVSHLMIYRADLVDGVWKNIRPMRFNVQEFSFAYPTLSANGKVLYFCSNRSGGYGGADIYKVERKDAASDWSGPVNLGNEINTEGDEAFPFIHLSGELYFSSNGHTGLGGLDVFKASNIDNKIVVENLGYGINGPKDDFGLIINERKDVGYFSSNRDGGKGKDDIYGFTYSKAHFEKLHLVKLAAMIDSVYTLDVNDPSLLDDPGLVAQLNDLGFVKDGFIKIKPSDISEIKDEKLREKLKKLGMFDSETLAIMLDDNSLQANEFKRKKLQKLGMQRDSLYTIDLSDSELLDDPDLVAQLTELGYLDGNVLNIKASDISKLKDENLKRKLNEIGLFDTETLAVQEKELAIKEDEQNSKKEEILGLKKKLTKLAMIKDSLYTIELNDEDFLKDPDLFAELEEMGYLNGSVLKIKASELKKLDRNIKERLAKLNLFDKELLGIEPIAAPPIVKEKKQVDYDYFIFMGSVQEHNSINKLRDVKILIRDKKGEKGQFVGKTDDEGIFRDTVRGFPPSGLVSLYITLKKKGYISKSFLFEEHLDGYGEINLDEFLKKIQMTKFDINVEIGSAANLNPIYFGYNQWDISETAKIELDKLAEILIEEPRLLIELGSHTDAKGNDEYNLSLSEKRANATKEYVVSMGVEAFRIKAVGYGETKLKNHCANDIECSDEEHAINRRTEFRVIGLN